MKHVTVTTDSVIGRYLDAEVSWADVWLRLKRRRKTVRLAPTVCGYLDLLSERDVAEYGIQKYPNDDWPKEDFQRYSWAISSVESNGYAVDNYGDVEMPELFSPKHRINRREAERLMTLWLANSMGFAGPFKFHWKPPKFFLGTFAINTASVRRESEGDRVLHPRTETMN